VMAVLTGLLVATRRPAGIASDRARSGHDK
jgi:hypothetical protein